MIVANMKLRIIRRKFVALTNISVKDGTVSALKNTFRILFQYIVLKQ
tara:strand:- start:879 stop:1019 length:141 start_codon:yes stop_codon:yes gene_type:complete